MFDPAIVLTLLFDGLTNGAIYAIMALGIVVLYSVTNVINVAQGEFVMLSALTVASFRAGTVPGTLYIVVAGLLAWSLFNAFAALEERSGFKTVLAIVWPLLSAAALFMLVPLLVRAGLGYPLQILLAVALTTLLGPICYRLIVQPLPRASVLVFLILAIGLHLALTGLGLAFWGPQPYAIPAFQPGGTSLGPAFISFQALWLLLVSALLMVLLALFFNRTMYGKALRAAAVNRLGARLSGISVVRAGSVSFTLSVFLSAVAGVLITPITKMVYDFGFLLGLKGFVGAIIGGLVNPVLAAAGALFVGVAEQFSAFYISSAYKDVLVFLLIIPVLLLRSLQHQDFEEHVD
ncbi:MAG TPA: branched-chain amino acid ABC transporter permease [Chloroflexota bacterium]|nr:branched-chain amino acid ABC transporter permease [Chloroflexota bacterium]